MLLKFVKADGNEMDSVGELVLLHKNGFETDFKVKASIILLGEAFAHMPNYKGFTEGQLFDISVKAVKLDVTETPITDGNDLNKRDYQ